MDRVMTKDEPGSSGELRLTAAPSTYAVFGVILGLPMLLLGTVAIRHPSAWQGVAAFGSALAFTLLYYSRLRVLVSQDAICYRTLLSQRRLLLDEIAESQVKWNVLGRDPRPLLVIASAQGGKPLVINLKPYRRDDIARFLRLPVLRVRHDVA